ncbi:uridine kinase [Actinotalea sp. Marseille-Q4924]|uniref:uridine kinase family protein n=1 Tax=Actinotalea sp. Marseille-Q4924 TaxID=2866571 RepID=UPI001CE46831|nr:hypothetical protein [Actinotalea sp. Marseille-Q4924]
MKLPPGEPELGPWRTVTMRELLDLVHAEAGDPPDRPRVVAVDGRGASGKSTLASRLHRMVPRSAVVHVDDLAWWEPLYEWGHLLADDVLRPLRDGRALSFRPPQWEARGRDGAIEVPAGLDLVVVEGTGASHAEHADLVDATVWVQSDFGLAEERGIARDVEQGVNGDLAEATAFWHDWMRAELAFFDRQRPWERACVAVNGTPASPVRDDEVQIAAPPGRAAG